MTTRNLILKRFLHDPVFRINITLYVSHDAVKTFNRVSKRWNLESDMSFGALCIDDGGGNFAVFFHKKQLAAWEVAHELDHLLKGIMAHIGHEPCSECRKKCEPTACYAGFLSKWLRDEAKRAKLKVK